MLLMPEEVLFVYCRGGVAVCFQSMVQEVLRRSHCSTGKPKPAGAAAGGGGREEAEEGVQGGASDERTRPEGAAPRSYVQVGAPQS